MTALILHIWILFWNGYFLLITGGVLANRMNLIAEVKEQTGEMKGLREIKRSDYNALATREGHEVSLYSRTVIIWWLHDS